MNSSWDYCCKEDTKAIGQSSGGRQSQLFIIRTMRESRTVYPKGTQKKSNTIHRKIFTNIHFIDSCKSFASYDLGGNSIYL